MHSISIEADYQKLVLSLYWYLNSTGIAFLYNLSILYNWRESSPSHWLETPGPCRQALLAGLWEHMPSPHLAPISPAAPWPVVQTLENKWSKPRQLGNWAWLKQISSLKSLSMLIPPPPPSLMPHAWQYTWCTPISIYLGHVRPVQTLPPSYLFYQHALRGIIPLREKKK